MRRFLGSVFLSCITTTLGGGVISAAVADQTPPPVSVTFTVEAWSLLVRADFGDSKTTYEQTTDTQTEGSHGGAAPIGITSQEQAHN